MLGNTPSTTPDPDQKFVNRLLSIITAGGIIIFGLFVSQGPSGRQDPVASTGSIRMGDTGKTTVPITPSGNDTSQEIDTVNKDTFSFQTHPMKIYD